MTNANKLARRLASWMTLATLLFATAAHAQTVIYYHTDALGSPVATTDATGTVIERSEYEPYGQVLNHPIGDGPGYTGHVSDAQTGLSYMQQRYYDPLIGRFMSMDPVTADAATGANFNRYWYANNNPYRFVDPDGRMVVGAWLEKMLGSPVDEADDARREVNKQSQAEFKEEVAAEVRTAPAQAMRALDLTVTAIGFTPFAEVAFAGKGVMATARAVKASETFFEGATLQKRVVDQIARGDNHAFPVLVDGFAAEHGTVKTVMDTRGNPVEMLTLPGAKNGEPGNYEYIKNKANEIYHRLFRKE